MAETKSILAKYISASNEMKNPTKDTNADAYKYKYKYATLDQVLGIVKPALAKNGLALMQRVEQKDEGYLLKTSICDENEIFELDIRPVSFSGDAQRDGSLETYYRRYSLMTVFGLAGEDDDGAATKAKKEHEHGKEGDKKDEDSPELKAAKLYFAKVCKTRGGWDKYLPDLQSDDGFEILKDVPDFWRKHADRIKEEVKEEA